VIPYRAARVLIVARETADSPELIASVARRARQGPCNFTLLVPSSTHVVANSIFYRQHRDFDAERRLATAVPLLSRAARSEVVAVLGASEPVTAVRDALKQMGFDEVIVSTLPAKLSRWTLDLPAKIRALGVPVSDVVSAEPPAGRVRAATPFRWPATGGG
jgi:hypothetical protein